MMCIDYFLPHGAVAVRPILILGLFLKPDGYFRVGAAAGGSAGRSEDQPAAGNTNGRAPPRQTAEAASWTGLMYPKTGAAN